MGSLLSIAHCTIDALWATVNTNNPEDMARLFRRDIQLFNRHAVYWPTSLGSQREPFVREFSHILRIDYQPLLKCFDQTVSNDVFLSRLHAAIYRK